MRQCSSKSSAVHQESSKSQLNEAGKHMTSRNVANGIKYLFDAFNAHDAEACSAGYSEDIRFTTKSGTVVGRENVRARFAASFERSPDVKAIITSIIDGGDAVVYEFYTTGHDLVSRDGVAHCDVVRFNASGEIISEDNYSGLEPPTV
jgi:hypothetical protein